MSVNMFYVDRRIVKIRVRLCLYVIAKDLIVTIREISNNKLDLPSNHQAMLWKMTTMNRHRLCCTSSSLNGKLKATKLLTVNMVLIRLQYRARPQ